MSVLRGLRVVPSPAWVANRLRNAGMRPISNIVDASNYVMLELGQPTHPYDAAHVAQHTLSARRARPGESLTTLDGTVRELAKAGRGLGDTGEDCVIVDGDDHVLGLAGIMGGASSEISDATTDVLLEAAYFDPMTIARSSKRHGLRSEASNRFERGVDPELALRAVARFVHILRQSVPDLEWYSNPIDVRGLVPTRPQIELRDGDVERTLAVSLANEDITTILTGLGFEVHPEGRSLMVVPPSARLDVRSGAEGRADVIEEVARLYGYGRIPRRTPTWPEPGGLNARQKLRRSVRDIVVDLGVVEAWTPTLGSEGDFELLHANVPRVRVTNPLASEESVLRATMITGLVRAWLRNVERGVGDVVLGEIGTVFAHPSTNSNPRITKGGAGGGVTIELPRENERLTIVFGRRDDSAPVAVGFWSVLAGRLGLEDVVIRDMGDVPAGFHPTRTGALVDRKTGAVLGHVGEIDSDFLVALAPSLHARRLGVLDVDVDVLADSSLATRRSEVANVPSRFPSAAFDLAFVTPKVVHAHDLAHALAKVSALVESVVLFDVYQDPNLPVGSRSLAYSIRLSAKDRTLSESEVATVRDELIACGATLGAVLR